MKIVYIYTAILEVGGVDRILTQKANYLADKMGHDVYMLTDSQAGKRPSFPISSKVHHVDLEIDFDRQYHHSLPVRAAYYFGLMYLYRRKLKAFLMKIRPDVTISTLGREMDFLTSIKDGSIKVGESHVVKQFCRNFHLMEQRGFMQRNIAHYWRRKQENAVKKLDALVLLTNYDKDSWIDVKEGVVIPNSIPFYPADSSTLQQKRCVYVARYVDDKGYRYLFDAWKIVHSQHPDWILECYGQGDRNAYQHVIDEMGLHDKVRLNGPTNQIESAYMEGSIFVMPSLFEGFGLVLAEAMACGVPCVSFDCPHGPREIIRDKEDGLLVPYLDVQALAQGICSLMENHELRMSMGQRAKMNIARFRQEFVMLQWENLFKSLVPS